MSWSCPPHPAGGRTLLFPQIIDKKKKKASKTSFPCSGFVSRSNRHFLEKINMLKLDVLRMFVDKRLSAVTDDIFRCLARTVAEYEHQVLRLKQDIDRQRRLLEAAGAAGDTPEDRTGDGARERPGGVLQVFTTEEEAQVRGQILHIKEEDRALASDETDPELTQNSDWLRERPETKCAPPSNQIQSGREEVEPQPAKDNHKVVVVKQEGDEGCMMLEASATAEKSSQTQGVLRGFTTQEEKQVRRWSLRSLHIKQEEGEDVASEPDETESKFTLIPDWLMESDEGSSSSNQIQSHREEQLLPTHLDRPMTPEPEEACTLSDHNRDSVVQSDSTEDSSDAQSEPGLQSQENWNRPSADQDLVCGSCGREFSSKQTLKKHIKQNLVPDQDQLSCSRRRQRIPYQSPAKKFSCRICGTMFYTQGLLVRHAEIHCRELESRCGACGDQLESTDALRNHLWSHKVLGSTCDVCGKKCTSIATMQIHKRVHTGEKPYHCGFCSRDFSRKESLERHLKLHCGDKQHHCGLCRRAFTRREYLIQHMEASHPERPSPTEGHFSLMLRNMSEKQP
ncbi:zinc finger protein 135-like isoform X2 [Channa argus]|nr:hypothetical protein Q8A73_000029 [Channa argus]